MFLPTDTASIAAPPVDDDDYAPSAGAWVERASGVSCHIAEKSKRARTPGGELSDDTIRYHRILFPRGTVVEKGDKVTTAVSGAFRVEHVFTDSTGFGVTPVRVDASRAGS